MMVMTLVEQTKMQDQVYKEQSVENDEYEENLFIFVRNDEEVAKAIESSIMRIDNYMGGMGGPGMM